MVLLEDAFDIRFLTAIAAVVPCRVNRNLINSGV
jgi:hypothetical protein